MATFGRHTNVSATGAGHARLQEIVAALIPLLSWRHHGLGVLQAYVREGGVSETRVHVWHPALVSERVRQRDVHDHRFDLTSSVLVGDIFHEEVRVVPKSYQDGGRWRVWSIVHKRAQIAGSLHAFMKAGSYDLEKHGCYLSAGTTYLFPKHEFHRTEVRGLAVTVVTKSNQDDTSARIVAYDGVVVESGFADSQPREKWQWILDAAVEALRR